MSIFRFLQIFIVSLYCYMYYQNFLLKSSVTLMVITQFLNVIIFYAQLCSFSAAWLFKEKGVGNQLDGPLYH